jgi:hypothetical protein
VKFKNEQRGVPETDDDKKIDTAISKKENQNQKKGEGHDKPKDGKGQENKSKVEKGQGEWDKGKETGQQASDEKLIKAIVGMKDKGGKDWDEIVEKLKISKRRAKRLYSFHLNEQEKAETEPETTREESSRRSRQATKSEVANRSKKRTSSRTDSIDDDSTALYGVQVLNPKPDERFRSKDVSPICSVGAVINC